MHSADLRDSRPSAWALGLDLLAQIRADQLGFYATMQARHGDAVRLRLGPYRSWLLFHPDQVEALLTRQHADFIRFEKLTHVVRQWNGDSLLVLEGAAWKDRRRKVLPAFQTRRLPDYGRQAVLLARRLTDGWRGPETHLDTDAVMSRLTLDVAARTLFGAQPLDNGDQVELALQCLSQVAFHESTAPFRLPDGLPLAAKRQKRWAIAVMDQTVRGLVGKGLARDRDEGDLLSMLITHHQGQIEEIRNDAMSLLIAGHETSGALLTWLFACLACAPDALGRLQRELEDALQDRLPTAADLPGLPYLRACIDEALRLYPPAYSLFLRRAVADVELAGVQIKKGDLVQVIPYAMHRDPRWFADPLAYRPERFLQAPTWPAYAYLPFGAGPRVCIGQNFGLMEGCLIVATVLQRWHPAPATTLPAALPRFSLRPKGGHPQTWRINGQGKAG